MSIYGNSFLISIAWKAESPTKAAKVAKLLGCTTSQIKLIREAAILKRDKGKDAFLKEFSPFTEIELSNIEYDYMKIKFKLDRLYETRGLNSAEFNEIAEVIEMELSKYGIDASIKRANKNPFVKSTLTKT